LSGTGTFAVREGLKQPGFRYSPDKRSWYWRAESDRSSNEKPVPIEMIRTKYGSNEVGLKKWQQKKMFLCIFFFLR
jgi:hypothetical protein